MIEYFQTEEVHQLELNNRMIELQVKNEKESVSNSILKIKESEREERIVGLIRQSDRLKLIIETFKQRQRTENNIDMMIKTILTTTSELHEKSIHLGGEFTKINDLMNERYCKMKIQLSLNYFY